MAIYIARKYDFQAGTKALSAQVDEELDQLVAAHNTSADIIEADATTLQANITAHTSRTDNPHSVTKAQVGLGNCDNTSDANKPVSAAQAALIATKVALTGDEIISGVKTFSASPIVPAPTTDMQPATKQYVDDKDGTAAHLAGAETVTGAKTFIVQPLVPTPTDAAGAVPKGYVDAVATARYTKTEMQTSGQSLMHWENITNKPNFADASWKTSVATKTALPLAGNSIGDQRVVLNDGDGKQAVYACIATAGTVDQQWSKVADVDWMTEEQTRVTQEAARVAAESDRVTAESGRVTAESTRVSQEGARATAETARAETFTTNESSRAATFTTNEAARQSTFDTNEAGRSAWQTTLQKYYTGQQAVQKFSYLEAALGNSIQITDTIEAYLASLEINGETVGKKAVFGTATVTVTGVASLPFIAGASITFSGFATTANNKTVTLSSISGLIMTFPASTFTAATELQGTISDGTNTVNIAVSPTDPQTLTSLGGFDYILTGKNLFDKSKATNGSFVNSTNGTISAGAGYFVSDYIPVKPNTAYRFSASAASGSAGLAWYDSSKVYISGVAWGTGASRTDTSPRNAAYMRCSPNTTYGTLDNFQIEIGSAAATAYEAFQGVTATIPLKDTSNNQLELRGIPATYNADGSVATWSAQDKAVKGSDGVWKLSSETKYYTVQSGDITALYNGLTNVDLVSTNAPFKADMKLPTNDAVATKNAVLEDRASIALTTRDNVSSIGKFYIAVNGVLAFVVAKGAYADLPAAKAAFAGKNIIYTLATPTLTELSAADQTALNSVEKSFAGTTNIMLSDSKGQVYAQGAKNTSTLATKAEVALKANIAQEAWIAPTLVNSFVNFGGTDAIAGYMKTTLGIVRLRGKIKTGASGASPFTLPAGYRPTYDLVFPIVSNDAFGYCKVTTAGVVTVYGNSTYYSLSGITFNVA